MITTAGMVSLTTKSLRQSTDGAQSTKAYYAAEGGLEEALLRIRSGDASDKCDTGASAANSAKDGVVTCTKISTTSNQLQGSLGTDEAVQLDVSSVVGLRSIKIEWSQAKSLSAIPDYSSAEGFRAKSDFKDPNNEIVSMWSANAPAIVEAGIVEYPGANEFNIGDVGFYQNIFAPKSNNPVDKSFGINSQPYIDNYATQKRAYSTQCVSTGSEYQCSMGIGGLKADKKYVLRLKTRYNPTDYRITAQGVNNVQLSIPGAMYTVDVTARAGDVFRRIQTSFSTDASALPPGLSGLDYVLYSDTQICKSFEVKASGATGIDCNPPI